MYVFEQCIIEIRILTNDTTLNKELVSDVITGFSFEYAEDINAVSDKAIAEDILSAIVADKYYNVYYYDGDYVLYQKDS